MNECVLGNGRTVHVGDTVTWYDPDNGWCTGDYEIIEIYNDEMGQISNGESEVEVYWSECE